MVFPIVLQLAELVFCFPGRIQGSLGIRGRGSREFAPCSLGFGLRHRPLVVSREGVGLVGTLFFAFPRRFPGRSIRNTVGTTPVYGNRSHERPMFRFFPYVEGGLQC